MVVTVDGPSGAGKSSACRALAARLGMAVLDTGALYRAVALGASLAGWDAETSEAVVAAQLSRLQIEARPGRGRFLVLLDGRDVEPFIRNERIGGIASRLSAMGPVRQYLLEVQRAAGRAGDVVAEGRDMGTVVFPDAAVKIFLTASDEERARRRFLELKDHEPGLTMERVRAELAERDQRDQDRALSPLRPAPDALLLDSSRLTLEQVVEAMEGLVRGRLN